jgi:hypothetical protein
MLTIDRLQYLIRRIFHPHAESAEYTAWRHQFLLDRLQLSLRIATPIGIILVVSGYAIVFSDIDKFDRDILKLFEDPSLGVRNDRSLRTRISVARHD